MPEVGRASPEQEPPALVPTDHVASNCLMMEVLKVISTASEISRALPEAIVMS